MKDDNSRNDLVLLDLHFSGLLRGEQAEEVHRRTATDTAFQYLMEQYLTDWAELLDMQAPDGLVPEGAETRLMQRLTLANTE